MQEQEHAALMGPSSAYKHFNCPASAMREKFMEIRQEFIRDYSKEFLGFEIEEEDTSARDEGNELHAWLESQLTSKQMDSVPPTEDEYVASRMIEIRDEILARFSTAEQVGVESRIRIKGVATFGTTDDWSVEGGVLTVGDLKTGRVEVVAKNNYQLMVYAVGILDAIGWGQTKKVRLLIHGARFKSSKHVITTSDLRKWRDEVMMPAYIAGHRPNAPAVVGEHCTHCRARAACLEYKAGTALTLNGIEFSGATLKDDTVSLEAIWVQLKEATNFFKLVAEELKDRFQGFEEPSILSLQSGRNTVQVAVKEAKLKELIEAGELKESQVYVAKLRTPTDMKKHIKDAGLVRRLFSTKIGAPILKIKQ